MYENMFKTTIPKFDSVWTLRINLKVDITFLGEVKIRHKWTLQDIYKMESQSQLWSPEISNLTIIVFILKLIIYGKKM